jgi:hypothetical protein
VASITEPKSIVGTGIEFIDPELLFINFSIEGKIKNSYNSTINKMDRDIKRTVYLYCLNNLQEFNDSFFNSDLVTDLMSNHSLDSVNIETKLEKRISPVLFKKQNITVDFNNEIYNPIPNNPISSLTSTIFETSINGVITKCFIEEDGNGNVNLCTTGSNNTKTVLSKIGNIDYASGTVVLQNFTITSYTNNFDFIKLFAKLKNKDIITNRNTILTFDVSSTEFINLSLAFNTGAEGLNNYSNPLTRR